MNTLATLLVRGLLALMRAIGRWVLPDLLEHGAASLAGYMRVRAGVFRKRLQRARSKLRKRWLQGRIRRWLKAAAWLDANAKTKAKRAADALVKHGETLVRRIPESANGERYDRWLRRQQRRTRRKAA